MKNNGSLNIDVDYVANLARLALSDEEREVFQRQLNDIVGYMREIEQVNVEGVEPTSHAIPVENVLRADEPRKGLDRDEVLANAPRDDGAQFLVPRIV